MLNHNQSTAGKKEDRRVAYTKTALREALIKLMGDKHISAITVKSLCKVAEVNRSTFYLHYRNQYDLLHQIEQDVFKSLEERLSIAKDIESRRPISLEMLTKVLEYAQENAALASVLLGRNCDFSFQQDLIDFMQILVVWFDPSYGERVRDHLALFVTSGGIACIEKWLHDGMVEPPEEVARLIVQIGYSGVIDFIKDNLVESLPPHDFF
jgi:AcrR family transcriptional regulator